MGSWVMTLPWCSMEEGGEVPDGVRTGSKDRFPMFLDSLRTDHNHSICTTGFVVRDWGRKSNHVRGMIKRSRSSFALLVQPGGTRVSKT